MTWPSYSLSFLWANLCLPRPLLEVWNVKISSQYRVVPITRRSFVRSNNIRFKFPELSYPHSTYKSKQSCGKISLLLYAWGWMGTRQSTSPVFLSCTHISSAVAETLLVAHWRLCQILPPWFTRQRFTWNWRFHLRCLVTLACMVLSCSHWTLADVDLNYSIYVGKQAALCASQWWCLEFGTGCTACDISRWTELCSQSEASGLTLCFHICLAWYLHVCVNFSTPCDC